MAQDANETKDKTPKYSNEFLNLGVGARSFGLALSSVAYSSDVTSGYWNPAGLLELEKDQGMLMHSSYFGGLASYDYVAFATEVDAESKLAVSVIRFSVDDIPDTRFLFDANGAINYDNIQFFAASDYAFIGSYARRLKLFGGVKAGGNIKIVRRVVGNFSNAWGFGIDAGLQKQIKDWKLGLTVRDVFGTFNAWSHNTSELEEVYALTGNSLPASSVEITLPRTIFGGTRNWRFGENITLMATLDLDFTFDGKRNTLIKSNFASIDPHGGMEVGYENRFFLRLGLGQFQKTENFEGKKSWVMQPTAGLGVDLDQVTIDYALTDAFNKAEGLYSHVFSIKINFDVKE
ncbi:MAG: hypothetical protein GY816_15860 [Cytophagales bacterium]|nr:hypothetical protein [Cytophagales bacterium]